MRPSVKHEKFSQINAMSTSEITLLSPEVRSVYRETIRRFHPDRVSPSRVNTATTLIQELNDARDQGDGRRIIQIAARLENWANQKDHPPSRAFTTEFRLRMIQIQPGSFIMGSQPGEDSLNDSETPHLVNITRPFWMARTQVTHSQWRRVMGTKRSPGQGPSASHPVSNMSWEEAKAFCDRATEQSEYSDWIRFTLPTEAQWEYACRAGTNTPYAKDRLEDVAWFEANSDRQIQKVGLKEPNAWGLYDMHGNVCAWCSDYSQPYNLSDSPDDPTGSELRRDLVVFRGGGYESSAKGCRSGRRFYGPPDFRSRHLGFRIAAVLREPS